MANLNKPNQKRLMPTVSVQLEPAQIAWLDEKKWLERKSMAEVVRDLVASAMEQDSISRESQVAA